MADDCEPVCDDPDDEETMTNEAIEVLAVPGLSEQSPEFVRALAEMARRHGWDPTGIAAVISHESRFMPSAHNPDPRSTATGLIQFIESTAQALGTSTAALMQMSALEQLPFVEAYFARFMPRVPLRPEDYLLVTYGRSNEVGADDSFVLDRKDSDDKHERARYAMNSALDAGDTGTITVGDLRRSLTSVLHAAHGRFITTHAIAPSSRGSGGDAGGALLALALFFGPDIFRSLREVLR